MALDDRSPPDDLSWLERLVREPERFDFHVALRRFEAAFSHHPRFGEAVRPADEVLRIGQEPTAAFEPSAIASFVPERDGDSARLMVSFLGLWGPNGPLPGHITEYARERARHAGDTTLTSFLDLFHHRALLLFHRAWAKTQPTAGLDRSSAGADAFASYMGAFFGMGSPKTRGHGPFPDRAKLFFAGRFAPAARNAEGLRDVISEYFGVDAQIEEYVGEWIDMPNDARWDLGVTPETGCLGRTTILGGRVWSRAHKFRIVLGPLSREAFERTLPSSETMATLAAIVRLYTNDEWAWDVRLVLAEGASDSMRLGRGARLGWTTHIGKGQGPREDLIIDSTSQGTRRARSTGESSSRTTTATITA